MNFLISLALLAGAVLLIIVIVFVFHRDYRDKPIAKFIINLFIIPLYIPYWCLIKTFDIFIWLRYKKQEDITNRNEVSREEAMEHNRLLSKQEMIDRFSDNPANLYFFSVIYAMIIMNFIRNIWVD